MELLLSELLPLRTTRALGDYAEDTILPEVLGDLTDAPFPLIRLDDSRFFAADHPMDVTAVYVERQLVADWAMVLESDGAGRTWTEIHFAAPVPPGSEVSAAGTGRLDDATGELIANPADIAERIDALSGRDEDRSALRAECSALNLKFAGRIFERLSGKAHIDAVFQSGGIIWAPGMARLYPSAATPSPVLDLDWREVDELDVSASLTDTADVLRLAYDRSDASGRAQHYIELTASPQRYGGLSKEVEYPWLRTPANAEAIGRPVLQRLAGERYDVAFLSTRRSLRPGQWVTLVAHPDWPLPGDDPTIMVLSVEIDQDSASVRVNGEYTVGSATVTVTAHSLALPDTVEPGVDVSVRDGVATFTFTDSDGRPIAGAHVSFDGGAPKTTDAQGKVRFPVSVVAGEPVAHELAFEKAGKVPFTVIVPL